MAGLDFDTAAQLVADLSLQMASLWARLEVLETTMPPVLPCSAPAITTTPHVFTCGVREHAPVDTTAASPDAQQIQDEGEQLSQIDATITVVRQIQAEWENLQQIGEPTDTTPEKSGKILTREADLAADRPRAASAPAVRIEATWGLVGDRGR
jgi:hypothetical protein